ncbi:MAG: tetratricopeptide repeat protein [Pseudomonadota bacterium]|nr:tetratricopeptide repeat protein [Pseudomonadota bacterium]
MVSGAVGAAMLAAYAIVSATAPTAPPLSPSALGDELYDAGDYRRAADALRAAYRETPTAELRFRLARALYGAGDFAGALEVLETRREAPTPQDSALAAETLLRLSRFDEARAAAEAAGSAYAGRFALIAARAYYAQGDHARAETHLAEALRSGGEAVAEAWLFRARVALEKGTPDEARASIKRALEAGAAESAAGALETEILIRAGETQAARAKLAKSAGPSRQRLFGRKARAAFDAQTEYLLGFADAADGDYANAARRLRAVEPWLTHQLHGRLILAAVKDGVGDSAQAEALYLDARRAAPGDPVALDAMAALHARAGRSREALEAAAALQTVSPQLGALRRLSVLARLDDVDGLLEAARSVETNAPAPPFASVALFGAGSAAARDDAANRPMLETLAAAGAARATGDAARAVKAAGALAPYTDNAAALMLAGDLMVIAGDDRAARERYRAAAALAPAAWAPQAGLLRLDVRAGDYADARRRLETQVAVSETGEAGHFPERLALARLLRAQGEAKAATEILAPVAERLAASANDALTYAELLAAAGETKRLADFAGAVRRAHPAAPETVGVLALAGLDREAAAAARRAVLSSPGDPARIDAYRAAMARIGASADAESFIEALARARPEATAPGTEKSVSREAAARAYYHDPADAAAAFQYGAALRAAGNPTAAAVLREACFHAAQAACAAANREET